MVSIWMVEKKGPKHVHPGPLPSNTSAYSWGPSGRGSSAQVRLLRRWRPEVFGFGKQADKVLASWGGSAWSLLCLGLPKLSCGIVFPAALQQCHGVTLVSAALQFAAGFYRRQLQRAPEDGINSTRWENSRDGGIRRRRQAEQAVGSSGGWGVAQGRFRV